jgi:hypothetical protein
MGDLRGPAGPQEEYPGQPPEEIALLPVLTSLLKSMLVRNNLSTEDAQRIKVREFYNWYCSLGPGEQATLLAEICEGLGISVQATKLVDRIMADPLQCGFVLRDFWPAMVGQLQPSEGFKITGLNFGVIVTLRKNEPAGEAEPEEKHIQLSIPLDNPGFLNSNGLTLATMLARTSHTVGQRIQASGGLKSLWEG